MMSSSQSIPFFQQYQYTNQPVEDSPTISKSKMLHKELLHVHDNRLDDDDASSSSNPSFLSLVSQHPTKRKRDDVDEITSSRRQDYDDSSSSSSDDEDDEGYILFPLHKRYASSSAFNVSSYDFERREGPADSSNSTTTRHNDSSFVDDTTTSDDVLDVETAALVSNFRTSIFRNQTSTMAAVVQPAPITPLSDASLTTCSLYADDDHDDDNYEGHYYPDFPSIGRATTIGEEHSYEEDSSSIFSDPPDMMDNSRSGTSSPRYEEEIMIEHHHCYEEEEDERSTSSTTELLSSIEEKDAVEAARELRPAWLVASSSTRLEPSQPSPLWMPTATSTTNWTGMFHQ